MISTPSGAADASLAPYTAPALDATSQARQRLGAGQFDQALSAGSALTQREAVARRGPPEPASVIIHRDKLAARSHGRDA